MSLGLLWCWLFHFFTFSLILDRFYWECISSRSRQCSTQFPNTSQFIKKSPLNVIFCVWPNFQTPRSSSKSLPWTSYFQLSSRWLEMWSNTILRTVFDLLLYIVCFPLSKLERQNILGTLIDRRERLFFSLFVHYICETSLLKSPRVAKRVCFKTVKFQSGMLSASVHGIISKLKSSLIRNVLTSSFVAFRHL